MISERIFSGKVPFDQIINGIIDEKIDIFIQNFYNGDKVNTATSLDNKKEDVA